VAGPGRCGAVGKCKGAARPLALTAVASTCGGCGLEASTPGTQAGLSPEPFSVEYNDVGPRGEFWAAAGPVPDVLGGAARVSPGTKCSRTLQGTRTLTHGSCIGRRRVEQPPHPTIDASRGQYRPAAQPTRLNKQRATRKHPLQVQVCVSLPSRGPPYLRERLQLRGTTHDSEIASSVRMRSSAAWRTDASPSSIASDDTGSASATSEIAPSARAA